MDLKKVLTFGKKETTQISWIWVVSGVQTDNERITKEYETSWIVHIEKPSRRWNSKDGKKMANYVLFHKFCLEWLYILLSTS